MNSFCSDQGRTRVCDETYVLYAANGKSAENTEQGKKSHLWINTKLRLRWRAYTETPFLKKRGGVLLFWVCKFKSPGLCHVFYVTIGLFKGSSSLLFFKEMMV